MAEPQAASPEPPAALPAAASSSLSEAERAERVAALRQRVAPLLEVDARAAAFCTPGTLERFTRAVQYDVDRAEEFLRRTLRWRGEKEPWSVCCAGCEANPRAHSLRCVGCDAARRPVLYHCFAQAEGRHNAAHNVAHLQRLLEECCALLDAGGEGEAEGAAQDQWVWLFDFHGYGLWDNNPATVIAAAQFLPMHPNRLFRVVLLDAPSAFSTVFSLASGYLADITKAKIAFTSLPQLREALLPWAGAEMADWLQAEAEENRRLSAAGAAAAAAKCYWRAPAEGAHDPRGLASFVHGPTFLSPTRWSAAAAAAAEAKAAQQEAAGVAGGEAPAAAPARGGGWLWGAGAAAAAPAPSSAG